MNKIVMIFIVLIGFVSMVIAINDYPQEITEPQIDIYLNIDDNNGIYTISVDGKECINKNPLKLNTINYAITNIADSKDIKNIDVFTFSVSNSTQQKYKDKEINLDFTLYGNGYILNKEAKT